MSETTATEQTFSDLTPYRGAQILTAALRKAGKIAEDKKIEPQSMYSKSMNALRVPGCKSKKNGGTGIRFVGNLFHEFVERVLDGQATVGAGGTQTKLDTLLAEYGLDGSNVSEADAKEPSDELMEQLEASLEANETEDEESDES